MSDVCIKCESYAAEALGLCGNCLLLDGKHVADYDPVLLERKRIRDAENKSGKFPETDLMIAKLAAMDRPPSPKLEGMRVKPVTVIGPVEQSDSQTSHTSEVKPHGIT